MRRRGPFSRTGGLAATATASIAVVVAVGLCAPARAGVPLPSLPPAPVVPEAPVVPPALEGVAAVAPLGFTGAASEVSSTTATVTGLLTAGTAPASYAFDYGATPSYGARTPVQTLPPGTVATTVAATLTGLEPGTAVHYRVIATSAAGTSAGQDRTLLTNPGPSALAELVDAVRGPSPGTTASVPRQAALGAPTPVSVVSRSGSVPVSGLDADFDDRDGRVVLLACLQDAARTGPLAPRGSGSFELAHRFRRAGRHDVRLRLLGGGCGERRRVLRTLRSTVTVAVSARAAGAPARPAAADCRDAGLPPTQRNLRRIERAVICLLTRERAAHGLGPLRASRRLAVAARRHANDMLRRRYLAHAHPRGPRLSGRLRRAGYRGKAGEIIGLGSGSLSTPEGIVRTWMGSTVHRVVILRSRYRAVGVGVRPGAPLQMPGAATYVANLGTQR